MPSDHLIWIDLEMTGLNPETDTIIEIATVVTDKDLNLLAEGPELAIHHGRGAWRAWMSGTSASTALRPGRARARQPHHASPRRSGARSSSWRHW